MDMPNRRHGQHSRGFCLVMVGKKKTSLEPGPSRATAGAQGSKKSSESLNVANDVLRALTFCTQVQARRKSASKRRLSCSSFEVEKLP